MYYIFWSAGKQYRNILAYTWQDIQRRWVWIQHRAETSTKIFAQRGKCQVGVVARGERGVSSRAGLRCFTTGGLPPIRSSWRQAPWDSGKVFLQLNTCGHSSYVISSLARGWVCCLQFLLALAKAVILRSESRGTHDHILLSQIRDCPNLEDEESSQSQSLACL
jgi:hypothetical protein